MEKSRFWRQSVVALALLGSANLVAAYFVFSTQRPLLHATSLELLGVEYMVGLRSIRESLPLFWQAKKARAGETSEALGQAEARVDAAVQELNGIDARLGAALGTTA